MKTKGFRKALALLLAFLMLSATFTMFAYADEPALDSFTTDNGASVRIGTVAGIRFKTTITKTQFDAVEGNIEEIGTLIAPAAFITGGTELTTELDEAKYVKVVADKAQPFAEDGTTVTFAGSLENIKDANYMLEYVARGYVVIDGTTYYAEMSDARTVGYTSYKAYLDQSADNPIKDNLAAKALIAPFANAYLEGVYGGSSATAAPTIDQIVFIEDFNGMTNETDVMAAMGLTDTYRNGINQNYIYGKDVTATAQDGKAVFVSKNSGRANHIAEDGFKGDEDSNNRINQDTAHGLFVITELNKSTLFANGNDTYVMQFTFDIDETTIPADGDCGIGLAVCEKGTNLGRGRFIAYSGVSWILCTEEGASPSEDSSGWFKSPGALTAYQDGSGKISQELTVRFVINIDQSVQQIYIDKGNGMELAHSGIVVSGAKQINNDFEIGLYFLKGGTIELDNFAVWSYKSES